VRIPNIGRASVAPRPATPQPRLRLLRRDSLGFGQIHQNHNSARLRT